MRNDIQALLELKASGAPIRSVLMIGRQWMLCVGEELRGLLATYGYTGEQVSKLFQQDLTFAEPFFAFLGAEKIESLDMSEFEGANIIQDLNQPLASQYQNLRYDLTVDGGSIEHVFNVPEALRTIMTLTKVGGYTYLGHPANNFCGHGFYQFSPELMFRVFESSNGFEVHRVILSETYESAGYRNGTHRDVRDPKELGFRSMLTSGMPMLMITIAHRTAEVPIFATSPMQSDYAAAWNQHTETGKEGVVQSEHRWRGYAGKVHPLHGLLALVQQKSPRLVQLLKTFRQPLSNDSYYKDYQPTQAPK